MIREYLIELNINVSLLDSQVWNNDLFLPSITVHPFSVDVVLMISSLLIEMQAWIYAITHVSKFLIV